MSIEKVDNRERFLWLDLLKGLCMFFVVMSHSNPPLLYAWLYTPLFLSGFFFASGYTFSMKRNWWNFFTHKAKTILVPYLFFGISNAVLACIVDGDNILERIIGLGLSVNCQNDDLWFIMCLFTMQLVFYWLIKLTGFCGNVGGQIGCVLVFCLIGIFLTMRNIRLPFQMETALFMMPFMYMGYGWRKSGKLIIDKVTNKNLFMLCSVVIVYVLICIVMGNTVNIHAEEYDNVFVFICQALMGTAAVVWISRYTEIFMGKTIFSQCISFIGRNTFIYYALQSKVIRFLDLLYNHFNINLSNYLKAPLYTVLCCVILFFPTVIINRYFPFVLGKRKAVNQCINKASNGTARIEQSHRSD